MLRLIRSGGGRLALACVPLFVLACNEPVGATDGNPPGASPRDGAPNVFVVDSRLDVDSADAALPDSADARDAAADAAETAPSADTGPDAPEPVIDRDGDGVADESDCAPLDRSAWRRIGFEFRDADGDGRTVPAPAGATVCAGDVLPQGYRATAADLDCDDTRRDVWQGMNGYADVDRDGVGAGESVMLCTSGSLPLGYSARTGDCAPDRAEAHDLLPYGFRDADGDGRTVPAAAGATVCSGTGLPDGYRATATELDCDDWRRDVWQELEGYVDADHDGVGAGARVTLCTAGALPSGYAARTGDCAPDSSDAFDLLPYGFRDADGDGRTVPAAAGATVCSGSTLPAGYRAIAAELDCDDARRDAWQVLDGYADLDRDGVGAGARLDLCTGASLPSGYSARDGDCAPDASDAFQLLPYGYRDADGDGRTVIAAASARVCSGAALPRGYTNVPGEVDCDDARATAWMWVDGYADSDGDRVGAFDPVRLCTNGRLPTGYVARSGDCEPNDAARWQSIAYAYRDADGDGATVASAGSLCVGRSLPSGYANEASGNDCNDADPSAWALQSLFRDADNDGVGVGDATSLCVGLSPAGFASRGGDCAETDATRWQMRPYLYRDADGDGRPRAQVGAVCSGAALPPGYATTALEEDCDDANSAVYRQETLFADADGDGVGGGTASLQCSGDTLPPGFGRDGSDCAPNDASRFRQAYFSFVDRDGDGVTVPERGVICGDGTLAPPYFAAERGLDCDDTTTALDHFEPLYLDADSDGYGAGRALATCVGRVVPAGYARLGTDENDSDPSVTEDLDDDFDLLF